MHTQCGAFFKIKNRPTKINAYIASGCLSVVQYVYRDERELWVVSATKIEGLISTLPRIWA